MADNTGGVDGKDICTGILNILGVEVANIKGVGGKDKKTCVTCSAINLAYNEENCNNVCRAEDCVEYYTDGEVGALEDGNHIYTDEGCVECANEGYYSDSPCGGDQRSCFTVDSDCAITRVDRCR